MALECIASAPQLAPECIASAPSVTSAVKSWYVMKAYKLEIMTL